MTVQYFKMLLLFFSVIILTSVGIIFSSDVDNIPILSSIPIYDKTGKAIWRTVWHPQLVTCYTLDGLFPEALNITFDKIGPCDLHKEVAVMQQEAGLSLNMPLFIIERNSGAGVFLYFSASCYIIGLPAQDMYQCSDLLARKAVIGHEIGHIVWNKPEHVFLEGIQNKGMYNRWRWSSMTGFVITCSITYIIFIKLYFLRSLTSQENIAGLCGGLLYGYSRWRLSSYASKLQEEELFCDKFPIETFEKTVQEKVMLAQGEIRYFTALQNKTRFAFVNAILRCMDWLGELLIPSTHPLYTERIAQLQNLICKFVSPDLE